MIKKEIWKDIDGYTGLYKVSNFGNILSCSKLNCSEKYKIGKILHPSIRKGYYAVTLSNKCVRKTFSIHRLVAQAFLENPNNYPIINHKDQNTLNNNVENLEWCTVKYNNNYGDKNEKISKPVIQYSLNGQFVKKWENALAASKSLKIYSGNICRNCKGILKTYKNYVWRYENDNFYKYGLIPEYKTKKIMQLDKEGKLIKIWDSIREASRNLNIDSGDICRCCKNKLKYVKGYSWKYYF